MKMVFIIAFGILLGYMLIKTFDVVMPKIKRISFDKIKERCYKFCRKAFGTREQFKKDMKELFVGIGTMWIIAAVMLLLFFATN